MSKKNEFYPYEIREAIKTEFGFLSGKMTADVVLKKLESGGYVKVLKKDQGKGPERTFYKISEKGINELNKAKELYKNIGNFLEIGNDISKQKRKR